MAYTKIKIEGIIEVRSGLHIGGDDSFSAIGAIDSPVVRDPLTLRSRNSWFIAERKNAFSFGAG